MKMNKAVNYLLVPGIVFLALSCRKDNPPVPANAVSIASNAGVYISNEGNFQFGNAKISYYDIANEKLIEDLYEPANSSPLGDVCQSMCLFQNKAYIVVNNSGKVEVVDAGTFKKIATITGLHSPRYFLPVSKSKAYVSDFKSNAISIVDLNTYTVRGSIPCPGWTEELVLIYGKAVVTNQLRDKVYLINTLTDQLEDSIQVTYGANSIQEDAQGKLWVLCAGNTAKNAAAGLFQLNIETKQVEKILSFANSSGSPWRLKINGSGDTLYFLNKGVYKLSVEASGVPATAFIEQGNRVLYGLGIDPNNNDLYVADALDYVQRGVIYRYSNDARLISTFLAGIIPGDFYFN